MTEIKIACNPSVYGVREIDMSKTLEPANNTEDRVVAPAKAVSEGKPKRSSQGPLTLWHGMRFQDLVRFMLQKPNLHWSRAGRLASLVPLGLYNSLMGAVESLVHGKRIARTELVADPVFILGHWRSGTTLVHNLMTSDPQFTCPTLYQALFPWHFLTTERLAKRLTTAFVPSSRPMDNMPVHWDIPQEDEFALCIMTRISPYMWMAEPGNLDSFRRPLDIESLTPGEQEIWKQALLLLLKKVTACTGKQVVLKSPTHTFRIRTLVKMFPNAKFVYIYRNPYDVFNSSCHLRRTLIEENTLGRPVFKDVESEVITYINRAFEAYESNRTLIPDQNLHEIKYEDLAADPLGQMELVYQALNIEHIDDMRQAVAPQVEKLKSYKKNTFVQDCYWAEAVYDRCRPVFDRFGYPSPLE